MTRHLPGAVLPLLLLAGIARAQEEPLTRMDLRPVYDAVVACAQRNDDGSCQQARQRADRLLDRRFVTALCKDNAFAVTVRAVPVAGNPYERREDLLRRADELMATCTAREQQKPAPTNQPPGKQPPSGQSRP